MDCKSVQEHAGDAIDRSMPEDLKKEFQAHLDRCKPCSREVALERLSKHMVQHNVVRVTTPLVVQHRILEVLQCEAFPARKFSLSAIIRWFTPRLLVPTFSAVGVAAAFFFIVNTAAKPDSPDTAHTAAIDLIHQSFDNFALLQSGFLKPALVSAVPESAGDFFQRSNLQFNVHVPRIRNCSWIGGSSSECSGVKRAHLFYKVGDDWVYVHEVSDDDGLYGTAVSLPPAAKRALASSGWYTDPDHPNCNVIVWKTGEAVCVAVSTMNKSRLLALLTTP